MQGNPVSWFEIYVDDAVIRWLPPHGILATIHDVDIKADRGYRMTSSVLKETP